MNIKYFLLAVVALAIGGLVGYYFGYDIGFEKAVSPTTFEQVGSPAEKSDLIKVASPLPNELVKSPMVISGEARGNWYFEASFPVFLYGGEGKLITQAVAQAQGEWMTEDFVPFMATLSFDKPETSSGELVLKKDNPSGLPKNEDEIRIPVKF